ncbi:4377_t:CDS:2 [Ambispora leptoticha]|uniref:4377_t:CDS:1 n=1 Tax=Ambispora leptoticha TaxID=144679 RepID=A0A9N8WBT3_9GLOM|nr:4377_t:CDS:2 [Ambispora leptoticha]
MSGTIEQPSSSEDVRAFLPASSEKILTTTGMSQPPLSSSVAEKDSHSASIFQQDNNNSDNKNKNNSSESLSSLQKQMNETSSNIYSNFDNQSFSLSQNNNYNVNKSDIHFTQPPELENKNTNVVQEGIDKQEAAAFSQRQQEPNDNDMAYFSQQGQNFSTISLGNNNQAFVDNGPNQLQIEHHNTVNVTFSSAISNSTSSSSSMKRDDAENVHHYKLLQHEQGHSNEPNDDNNHNVKHEDEPMSIFGEDLVETPPSNTTLNSNQESSSSIETPKVSEATNVGTSSSSSSHMTASVSPNPKPEVNNYNHNSILNVSGIVADANTSSAEQESELAHPSDHFENKDPSAAIYSHTHNKSSVVDEDENSNNNFESRRWRNNRHSSSHADSEKTENNSKPSGGGFTIRRISDAEFQALPVGSRLFLGNLSTHSTSKQELFDIFSPYGEILQISIKNSFGFVQYDNPERLEVSHGKPWHHASQDDGGFKGGRQNSRGGYKDDWHQHERGGFSPTRGHHGQQQAFPPDRRYDEFERSRQQEHKIDRRASYDSRGSNYEDHREYRGGEEFEFRGGNRNDRGGYRRNSYRDEHREERYVNRAKPYRIPSREFNERRPSREFSYLPECQIIVLDEIERNMLWEVERAFTEASISVHSIHLSRKKLHINAVIRQMIVEGVHAMVFLERMLLLNGRVNVQVFDQSLRTRDANVKYDEYENIRIDEAVALILRARTSQPPQQQQPVPPPSNMPPTGGQGIPSMPINNLGGVIPQQAQQPSPVAAGMLPPQHQQPPPNLDVQQILRQLAPPQNAPPMNNHHQNPYMSMPPPPHSHPHLNPTIVPSSGPISYNGPMMGQPPLNNPPPPIAIPPHNALAQPPQSSQYGSPVGGPTPNIPDIMSQFKQYSNQR